MAVCSTNRSTAVLSVHLLPSLTADQRFLQEAVAFRSTVAEKMSSLRKWRHQFQMKLIFLKR